MGGGEEEGVSGAGTERGSNSEIVDNPEAMMTVRKLRSVNATPRAGSKDAATQAARQASDRSVIIHTYRLIAFRCFHSPFQSAIHSHLSASSPPQVEDTAHLTMNSVTTG
jgi:hypothetical protein